MKYFKNALLKLLLGVERATGAQAIVNHHNYRFRIDSGAVDHGNAMEIPWKYIFPTPCKFQSHIREAAHVGGLTDLGAIFNESEEKMVTW